MCVIEFFRVNMLHFNVLNTNHEQHGDNPQQNFGLKTRNELFFFLHKTTSFFKKSDFFVVYVLFMCFTLRQRN